MYRNIIYLSDRNGTGKWRRIWPIHLIDSLSQSANVQADYMQLLVGHGSFYKGMTSVTVQRWIADDHVDVVKTFLKPICDSQGGWFIYEIDDNMSDKYIPLFNRGRKAFEGEKVQNNIKELLNMADLVTTTTDYLKEFYHKEYGVPLENIVALPNLLPRYLYGDRFDLQRKISQFKAYKALPRIGVVSSLSHFNVDKTREDDNGKAVRKQKKPDGTEIWVNEKNEEIPESSTHVITDDFDGLIDVIKATVNEFRWVFMGYCPQPLEELARKNKIEVHQGSSIMNYASVVDHLQLQAVIAPIKDIEFNRCKSFIKYMECAALGIPLFASNALPYNRVMPQQQLFLTGNELIEKLRKLKFASTGWYQTCIENQWKWLNSPTHEGDFDLQNFWLEDNIKIWVDLFKLRQKTLNYNLSLYPKILAEKAKLEKENILFKNDKGIMVVK